ncbi:hypothetical protein OsI_21506 [Oryza sativa Indica Group]|uniref:DUF3615 domain-containing protein n=1 Tax=Oryza sativa subsp. indica TaxID=39946 RepID=B8B287_ORYSI|nr:hypothetical protein OsI_21506 [Oryza sativa Indica Group]
MSLTLSGLTCQLNRRVKSILGTSTAADPSAQELQEPDALLSGELLSSTALKEPITASTSSSPQTVRRDGIDASTPSGSSPGSSILVRRPPGWYFVFYIRMDPGGRLHMYPDVGNGPYRSLPEVDDAINQHLHNLRIPEMGEELDRLPLIEIGGYEKDNRCLVQALVEKYNDDHNLLGDFAYELKEFLQIGVMYEDQRYYYHINFTTKTKGAHKSGCAMDNLFFAELSHMQGKDEWVISCCCVIKPAANGHCYGCRNDGKSGLKHPNNSDAYSGGHLDGCLPFGLNDSRSKYDGLNPEDEEAMLRSLYKGMDEPGYLEGLFA